MRLPRLRIRTLMMAVAVVAAFAGAAAWGERRSIGFRVRAARHKQLWEESLELPPLGCIPVETPRSEYHAALRAKYERAARRPWLPVPPDQPLPE